MKNDLTIEQREAMPNKALSVMQPDGLWMVYEQGDALPYIEQVPEV